MADPADKYCCNITTYVKINQDLIRQRVKIHQEIMVSLQCFVYLYPWSLC